MIKDTIIKKDSGNMSKDKNDDFCKEFRDIHRKVDKNGIILYIASFLVTIAFTIILIIFGYLNGYSKDNTKNIHASETRITRLEVQYETIIKGIERIEKKIK